MTDRPLRPAPEEPHESGNAPDPATSSAEWRVSALGLARRRQGTLIDLIRIAFSSARHEGTIVIARYRLWMRLLQEIGDLLCVALAYLFAGSAWALLQHRDWLGPLYEVIPSADWARNALVTAAILLPVFHAVGLYRGHHSLLNIREYELLLRGWAGTLVGTVVALFFIERSFQSRGIFLTVWALLLPLLYVHRFAIYHLTMRLHRRGAAETRAAIFGTGEMGCNLLSKLRRSPRLGYDIVGFLDDSPLLSGREIDGLPVLGSLRELPALARTAGVELLFIALPQMSHRAMLEALQICRRLGIRYRIVPSLYEIVLDRIRYAELDGLPLVEISPTRPGRRAEITKRGFDIALGSCLLALSLPVLLPLTAIVAAFARPSILQRQVRVGKDGRLFALLAFGGARAPAGGRSGAAWEFVSIWLDRTGLRDLPALWNVVRGDLSLVGPEPVPPEEARRFDELQKHRLVVRPGLTGLWRITPDPSPGHRMECVFFYIQNMSLTLDLVILAKSLERLFFGPGRQDPTIPGR